MADGRQDAYVTLVTSDTYLPGALVLAYSLRQAGTKKTVAVMVVEDALDESSILELRDAFDSIIPVQRILNRNTANLYLMNRLDLVSTFTKINLWRLSQYRKIVYVDADIVALRAPDELFNLESRFSASPDVGWPDCFNSGVMVLSPDMGDYYSLSALAQRGISFDGADQGLLNMHFKDWNRISFGYNVTPSGNYQYAPAFKHFQSTISMVHFIGPEKPWQKGRASAREGSGPYSDMLARWWAVYDRHYRLDLPFEATASDYDSVDDSTLKRTANLQRYVKDETLPPPLSKRLHRLLHPSERDVTEPQTAPEEPSRDEASTVEEPTHATIEKSHEVSPDIVRFEAPLSDWDATRSAPLRDSKPEASGLSYQSYESSWSSVQDPGPFKAPPSYPEPPTDMYYQVPDKREPIKPIFPWEKTPQTASRVFYDSEPVIPLSSKLEVASEPRRSETEAAEAILSPATSGTSAEAPASSILSYSRTNAWDDDPEIDRYLQRASHGRKAPVTVIHQDAEVRNDGTGSRRGSTKITEFPSAVERPSLPVTPAPRRADVKTDAELPPAEGVPRQEDWDPAAKLEELQRRGSLLQESLLQTDHPPASATQEQFEEPPADQSAAKIAEQVVDSSSAILREPSDAVAGQGSQSSGPGVSQQGIVA